MDQQTQPQQDNQDRQERVAAAIGAILAGAAVEDAATAIGHLLLTLLPASIPHDLAGRIAGEVTVLVTRDHDSAASLPKLELVANDEPLYRAWYAINALQRLADAVTAPGDGSEAPEEKLAQALSAERTYMQQHEEAAISRTKGRALNAAAADIHGPILSWIHLDTAHTHRPSHVAANGHNYDVSTPPASTEGMFPGMAPHCDCVPGPPREGAPLLV